MTFSMDFIRKNSHALICLHPVERNHVTVEEMYEIEKSDIKNPHSEPTLSICKAISEDI